jgi:ribonuclease HII
MSHVIIAGIDEVGRGALAGPVVAAACVCSKEVWKGFRKKIMDSKMLSPKEREEGFIYLIEHCAYGVGSVSAAVIDREGILAATEKAMQKAVRMLTRSLQPTYLLIDGRDKFWFDVPHSSIIRGDETEECIAAASIIAKVTRDRFMCSEDANFPEYRFGEHKGYGTPDHQKRLRKHGPCLLHRRSFLGTLPPSRMPLGAFFPKMRHSS